MAAADEKKAAWHKLAQRIDSILTQTRHGMTEAAPTVPLRLAKWWTWWRRRCGS